LQGSRERKSLVTDHRRARADEGVLPFCVGIDEDAVKELGSIESWQTAQTEVRQTVVANENEWWMVLVAEQRFE
jgi:hypothetical protein